MLTNNLRIGKILLYVGFLSLFTELFAIYYVTPSASNPSIPVHPILNYLGNGEQFIGNLLVFSILIISLSFLILDDRKLYLISYIISALLMSIGTSLFIYGLTHSIPVATQIGPVNIQPYTIRGVLTAFSGSVLLVFTLIFQFVAIREGRKKQMAF